MRPFVHLHNHTAYSLLDGAGRIADEVARAAELGMPALAITDHGVMYGAVEFYRACKKAGIKPIIGCEAFIIIPVWTVNSSASIMRGSSL